jgi:hypothetical protein
VSQVTAVVLTFSADEEDSLGVPPPPLAALQAWFRRADVGQLVAVDQLFGGWKHPGIVCLGGGFNHLNVGGFVELFRAQDWRHPEQAVLVLTTEDEPAVVVRPPGHG